MAKKLKDAAGSETKIAGMEPVKLDRLVASIKRARQAKDDANTAHASIWKEAKDAGCHTEALKLALKLDKMEDDKRNDFLRSFDQLRGHLGLNRALDMFDQVGAEVSIAADSDKASPGPAPQWDGNDAPFDVDQPGESGEEVIPAAAAEDEQQEEAAAAEPETAADWRDAEIPVDQMPEDAGACFNAGCAARRAGEGEDANPHDHTVDLGRASCWLKGWRHADVNVREEEAERAAAEAAALAADVATAEADVAAADADNVRPFPTPAAEGDLQEGDTEDEPAEKPKRSRRAVASAVPPSRFEPGAAYTV